MLELIKGTSLALCFLLELCALGALARLFARITGPERTP
jgi:hypothetical protein